jgi:hypothetical protein
VIPPQAYRPEPGWYRHGDCLRWHTGSGWTDKTMPLPNTKRMDAGMSRRAVVLASVAVTLILFMIITSW